MNIDNLNRFTVFNQTKKEYLEYKQQYKQNMTNKLLGYAIYCRVGKRYLAWNW